MIGDYRLIECADDNNIAPLVHRWWHVEVGGKHYKLSYLEKVLCSDHPECMAFRCDERGIVDNWEEMAVSYEADPDDAFAEVMGMLMEGEAR